MTRHIDHGTYAGYQQERKADQEHCAPCRVALADYQRNWRVRTGRTMKVEVPTDLLARLADRAGISDPAAAKAARKLLGSQS